MPDFRISDTAPEHSKIRNAAAGGIGPVGLWAMAGAYCMSPTQLTDGWVPEYWVLTWRGGKKAAAALVKVGLWHPAERDGIAGWRFHDWPDYQRLAEQFEEERAKARDRMRTLRGGKSTVDKPDVRANNNRTFGRTANERSANVHDSLTLTLTHGGPEEGGTHPASRARETNPPPPNPQASNGKRPADRCTQHTNIDGDPGPCRACGDARRAAEAWDVVTEAERRRDIRECHHCDADGWRREHGRASPITPYIRCDHTRDQLERLAKETP